LDKLNVDFTGGPKNLFDVAGRETISLLISNGLKPNSNVLDIGCGCLRIGWWLCHFLLPNHYYGIEPNTKMVNTGIEWVRRTSGIEPIIDANPNFDFNVFGVRFDYYVARSIWSHAAKYQIEMMLDNYLLSANPNAKLFASYLPARLWKDYDGDKWVGRSHESDIGGMIRHRYSWVKRVCTGRGLKVTKIKTNNFGRQKWLMITRDYTT